jgi:hypothetical protein
MAINDNFQHNRQLSDGNGLHYIEHVLLSLLNVLHFFTYRLTVVIMGVYTGIQERGLGLTRLVCDIGFFTYEQAHKTRR